MWKEEKGRDQASVGRSSLGLFLSKCVLCFLLIMLSVLSIIQPHHPPPPPRRPPAPTTPSAGTAPAGRPGPRAPPCGHRAGLCACSRQRHQKGEKSSRPHRPSRRRASARGARCICICKSFVDQVSVDQPCHYYIRVGGFINRSGSPCHYYTRKREKKRDAPPRLRAVDQVERQPRLPS